jgi:hypothetical protein
MGIEKDGSHLVKVSLVEIADEAQSRLLPTSVKRNRVTVINSYPLFVGAMPSQVLANTPKRKGAQLICNGNGYLALGSSQSECEAAASGALNEFIGSAAYIDASKMQAPIYIGGTTEMWAVLITVGSNPTVVSAIKEIET